MSTLKSVSSSIFTDCVSAIAHTPNSSISVADDEEDVDYLVRSLSLALEGPSREDSHNQVTVNSNISAFLHQHDGNLKDLITSQEAALESCIDEFIEHHCNEAENLCVMFNQVSECEAKLQEFEHQIVNFLDRLTDTADEVIEMQRSTEMLNLRLENRKKVKQEITQVYEAIMECGKFCEDISHKAIDEVFLREMEEYDDKLSKWHELRDKNRNLIGSAIDMEIRPRLENAAEKVGVKLQRYFIKRFSSLQEPAINIALHQQIMETTGRHAFRFLLRYNAPISLELRDSYISIISAVHSKALLSSLKDFVEVLPFVNLPFEPVINNNIIKLITDNKDLDVLCTFQSPHHSETSLFYFRDEMPVTYNTDVNNNINDGSLRYMGSSSNTKKTINTAALRATDRCKNKTTGSTRGPSSKFSFDIVREMKSLKGSLLSKIKSSHTSEGVEEMATPFTASHRSLQTLTAATFEDSIYALRSIHILEPFDSSLHQSPTSLTSTYGNVSIVNMSTSGDAPTDHGLFPENYMGMVVNDPVLMSYLAHTDSVVARFVELMRRIVNAVIAERKFVRNFILGGVNDSRRADLEEEEVLRTIFFQTLDQIDKAFSEYIPVITDSITLLCCLRATEILKNFVFKSHSPNPILLLSSLFECVTNSCRRRISQLMEYDKAAIETANNIPIGAVGRFTAKREQGQYINCDITITMNPTVMSTLRTHPITMVIARLTSKLHAINVLRLNGSFVNEHSDVSVFDQTIADGLHDIIRNTAKLIESMTKRVTDSLKLDISNNASNSSSNSSSSDIVVSNQIVGMVFKINNLGHLLYRWVTASRTAQGLNPADTLVVQQHITGLGIDRCHTVTVTSDIHKGAPVQDGLLDGNGINGAIKPIAKAIKGKEYVESLNSSSYVSAHTSQLCSPTSTSNIVASMSNSHTLSDAIKELDTAFHDTIVEFIHIDIKQRFSVLQNIIDYIQPHYDWLKYNSWKDSTTPCTVEGEVPVATEVTEETAAIDSVHMDEEAFVAILTAFSKACQHILQEVNTNVRGIFGVSSSSSRAVDGNTNCRAAVDDEEHEQIAYRVLTEYFAIIVELNSTVVKLAQRYFPEHSTVQAKLISGHAMEYELKKFLR